MNLDSSDLDDEDIQAGLREMGLLVDDDQKPKNNKKPEKEKKKINTTVQIENTSKNIDQIQGKPSAQQNISSISDVSDFQSDTPPPTSSTTTKESPKHARAGTQQQAINPPKKNEPSPRKKTNAKKRPPRLQQIKIEDISVAKPLKTYMDFLDEPPKSNNENDFDIILPSQLHSNNRKVNTNAGSNSDSFQNLSIKSNPVPNPVPENISIPNVQQEVKDKNLDIVQDKSTHNQTIEDSITFGIENRLVDYFNASIQNMINEFSNELHCMLQSYNQKDAIIQNFAHDLKKNIRQCISLKSSYIEPHCPDDFELYLGPYRDLFQDIHQISPVNTEKKINSLRECRNSITSKLLKIRTEMSPSVDQIQQEITDLFNQIQNNIQKEKTSYARSSSVLNRLAELEYKEIIHKSESELFYRKRNRAEFDRSESLFDINRNEILDKIKKLVGAFRHQPKKFDDSRKYLTTINECREEISSMSDSYHMILRKMCNLMNFVYAQQNTSTAVNFSEEKTEKAEMKTNVNVKDISIEEKQLKSKMDSFRKKHNAQLENVSSLVESLKHKSNRHHRHYSKNH